MPQRTLILTPQFEINFLPLIICQGSETQLAIKDIQSTGAQTFAKGEIGAVSLMSEIEGIDRVKAEMGYDHRTKFVIGQDEYKYFKIITLTFVKLLGQWNIITSVTTRSSIRTM